MPKMIYCTKLQKEAEALKKAPYPGELGKRILTEISTPAWQAWVERQTTFINELRLNMLEAKDRDFLKDKMQQFLFEDKDVKPDGFVSSKKCG